MPEMPEVETFANDAQLLADWEKVMVFRTQAQKALEEARNEKVIGKSLEAHLTAYVSAETKSFLEGLNADLAQLLIVSDLTVTSEVAPASAPSEYYVNVADLEIGDSITVADMELEGDIEVITEPDTTVVSISAPEEIIEEELDADAEMPEPELIGADDDEEED